MARHLAAGLNAVLDSATICDAGRVVVVNPEEVPKALDQLKKLTGMKYPKVEAYKGHDERRDRIHLIL